MSNERRVNWDQSFSFRQFFSTALYIMYRFSPRYLHVFSYGLIVEAGRSVREPNAPSECSTKCAVCSFRSRSCRYKPVQASEFSDWVVETCDLSCTYHHQTRCRLQLLAVQYSTS